MATTEDTKKPPRRTKTEVVEGAAPKKEVQTQATTPSIPAKKPAPAKKATTPSTPAQSQAPAAAKRMAREPQGTKGLADEAGAKETQTQMSGKEALSTVENVDTPVEALATTRDKPAKKADKQSQSAPAGAGKQGDTTSGKEPAAPADQSPAGLRGGTKQVLIEVVPMPARPGRPQKEEEYPFALLTESQKVGQEIVGPSFFIPDSDEPAKHVAAARKRHKGALFWVRKAVGKATDKGPEVPGMRVWRGSSKFKA